MKPGEREAHLTSFAEQGGKQLMLNDKFWYWRCRDKAAFETFVRTMSSLGVCFGSCHGLWCNNNDLNWPDPGSRPMMWAEHREFMALAADFNLHSYVVHPGILWRHFSEERLWAFVGESVEQLLPAAQKRKITLALENNLPENQGYDSRQLADFYTRYADDFLGFCFDSGHAHVAEDVQTVLAVLGEHVVTCHLHDNNSRTDQHLPPGDGTIDWTNLMHALKTKCPRLKCWEAEAPALGSPVWSKTIQAYRKLESMA